jgi:alanine-glyoxylate transaminase / serine-glyoxylate transaminase / serine-pyruvate transaminase
MGLTLMGVKLAGSGVRAAMDHFSTHHAQSSLQKVA